MVEWLAGRIELGRLQYNAVVEKYPEFKSNIDIILKKDYYIVKADGSVTKN